MRVQPLPFNTKQLAPSTLASKGYFYMLQYIDFDIRFGDLLIACELNPSPFLLPYGLLLSLHDERIATEILHFKSACPGFKTCTLSLLLTTCLDTAQYFKDESRIVKVIVQLLDESEGRHLILVIEDAVSHLCWDVIIHSIELTEFLEAIKPSYPYVRKTSWSKNKVQPEWLLDPGVSEHSGSGMVVPVEDVD